jgi:hypothetical protein
MIGQEKNVDSLINEQEKSMIIDARLTESEARGLYEAAQRLRVLVETINNPTSIVHQDILLLCDFVQENI